MHSLNEDHTELVSKLGNVSNVKIIFTSLSCCCIMLCFGIQLSTLSAAIQPLSHFFRQSPAVIGNLISARGCGYLIGSVSTGLLLEYSWITISSIHFLCSTVAVFGISIVCMPSSTSLVWFGILTLITGLCMGVFDVYCVFLLSELWGGIKVAPWLQLLYACFGIGTIIGPSLVAMYGFQTSFYASALATLIPLGAFACNQYVLPMFLTAPTQYTTIVEVASPMNMDDNVLWQPVQSPQSSSTEIQGRPVPLTVRALLFSYYAVYIGLEVCVAAWVATFAIDTFVTSNEAHATLLVSAFYGALACSRCSAVPISFYFSNSTILRTCIVSSFFASILALSIGALNYQALTVVSVLFGLSFGPYYSLGFTIPVNYGCRTLDSASVSACVVGGALGEIIFPVIMGSCMASQGPKAFTVGLLLLLLPLYLICLLTHFILTRSSAYVSVIDKSTADVELTSTAASPLHVSL
jgi:fucose permease